MAITLKNVRYMRITHILVLSFAVYLAVDDRFYQGIALGMISTLFNSMYPPDYGGIQLLNGKTTYTVFFNDGSLFIEFLCELVAIAISVAVWLFLLG